MANIFQTTCLVCGAVLPFQQGGTSRLCRSPQCRGKYASLLPHQICAICGKPLSPRELAAAICGDTACQQAMASRRERQKAEALREEVRQLRESLAGPAGIKEPEAYPLTLIPSFSARVTNLPDRRRRAFRDHILRLISQATTKAAGSENISAKAPATATAALPARVQGVLARACGLCQGNCCKRGGEHAYLTVATIRRYLAAHPGMRPREVLAAYLARLGNKTYHGSCVFHRADGCSLPRDMRSDTCNQYFCDALKEFQNNLDGSGRTRGFFAAVSSTLVRGTAFLVDDG